MSGSPPLLRLIRTANTVKPPAGKTVAPVHRYNLQVSCRVKPNAPGNREGVTAVGAEKVDVCVAAIPRKGEANAAVSRLLAQILNVPKSNVDVIQGLKSRDKTLCITDLYIGSDEEEIFLQKTRKQLEDAIVKK